MGRAPFYSVHQRTAGAERESATPEKIESCAPKRLVAGVGFEPEVEQKQEFAQSKHNSTKPLQDNALDDSSNPAPEQNLTPSSQSRNTGTQEKRVHSVYENGIPDDLAEVVGAWSALSQEERAEILATIRTARNRPGPEGDSS